MTDQSSTYQPWSVEDYIANAPDRKPRFTAADLRIVAEKSYENGWDGALIWASTGRESGDRR